MADAALQKGHCRCGSVSLQTGAKPDFAVYCHCDDCRRATGAPVLASFGLNHADVTWTGDETLARHKVGTATRLFCNNCGSPVAQEHDSQPDMIFINTAFMEAPENFPPKAHTFAGRKLAWLQLHDDLPKHDKTILIETKP